MIGVRVVSRWVLAIALVGLLLTDARASADTAIPPAPAHWVTDGADMLSEGTRAALDARLRAYEAKSGHQVVVWIGRTIGSTPLDAFATKAFETWRIGRKGHDDGVLMIVLADDHAIDIEVGYGLEDRLTDALSHRIIDEVMAPRLRAGDPDSAISAGVDAVLADIEGDAVSATPDVTSQPIHVSPAAAALVALLAACLLLFAATHPSLALFFLFSVFNGGSGFGSSGARQGGFRGGGGRSGGGGARGRW
ncbi:MAG TPA: TPM domain-containing protein [Polyangiaceae bacterium]|nr:TPM domain-containing protein [Polyangiaceae bacterium]